MHDTEYKLPAEAYAINRYGRMLAGEVPLLVTFSGAVRQHRAVVEHHQAMGEAHHGAHGVLDDDDGEAAAGQRLDHRRQILHRIGTEAGHSVAGNHRFTSGSGTSATLLTLRRSPAFGSIADISSSAPSSPPP